MNPPKPTVGRIVRYVLEEKSPRKGEVRPAIVVAPLVRGQVELQVFTADGDGLANIVRRNAAHSGVAVPGTWHWPSREEVAP